MRQRDILAVVYKTKVSQFNVKNYIANRHRWEGKVQKNAQFSFIRQRKAFLYKIVLRGIGNFLYGGALGLF